MGKVSKKEHTVTNVEVAVYALGALGGAEKAVFSEDVAAKCYELMPSSFCWRLEQYRNRGWPDKYVVKTALEDAKKLDQGALVGGSYALDQARDGWRITEKGAKWLRENQERIEKALHLKHSSIPKRDAERFVRQIRDQFLFKEFQGNKEIGAGEKYQFTDMLSCSPDAPVEVIERKFQRMCATAELVQDQGIIQFLEACRASFIPTSPELGGGVR